MGLFQDEKAKAETVLLADEVKAKSWLAANKTAVIAFIAGVVLGVILRAII